MCHAPLDAPTTINAMSIQSQYGTSWWDALIVASAVRAGCRYIVSEDMQAGMRFGAVTIVNPFESSPDEVLRTH
jgi:predicted nucleic acid-binding protein